MKIRKRAMFFGVIALLFVQISTLQAAKEETKVKKEFHLTTYYPAPHGDYKNINTTGDTRLATSSGNVGIGTKAPDSSAKLEVDDTLRLTPVSGDAAAQTGGVEGAIRYSKDANGAGAGGLLYRNASGWAPLAGGGGTPSSWSCTMIEGPLTYNTSVALCPEGYVVITGGCNNGSDSGHPYQDASSGRLGWKCWVYGTPTATTARARAVCCA